MTKDEKFDVFCRLRGKLVESWDGERWGGKGILTQWDENHSSHNYTVVVEDVDLGNSAYSTTKVRAVEERDWDMETIPMPLVVRPKNLGYGRMLVLKAGKSSVLLQGRNGPYEVAYNVLREDYETDDGKVCGDMVDNGTN